MMMMMMVFINEQINKVTYKVKKSSFTTSHEGVWRERRYTAPTPS
jgi:hypothetical protein